MRYLILLITAFIFTACNHPAKVVGKWQPVHTHGPTLDYHFQPSDSALIVYYKDGSGFSQSDGAPLSWSLRDDTLIERCSARASVARMILLKATDDSLVLRNTEYDVVTRYVAAD